MKLLAFDIETDGLLMAASTIHCGVPVDITIGDKREFTDPKEMYNYLCTADRIVGHNARMFDVPVMERIVGRPNKLPPLPVCLDTLLISRLLWPDKGNTPAGGHSLEKWGEYLGIAKAHAGIEDWSKFTPEMLERCVSDVKIQVALYNHLIPMLDGWGESVQIEHTVASIITKQIQNGFALDMDRVEALEHDLLFHRAGATDELGEIPSWWKEAELKTPQYWEHTTLNGTVRKETKGQFPSSVRGDLVRGPNKIKRTEIPFNSASTDHVARLFIEKYRWEPKKLTETGKPVVSEEVLKTLDYPEAQTIARIKLIDKRLSQIAQWRKYVVNGRLHGDVITNGCVSGRMSHSKPNMAQIPASHSPWGKECRECFVPSNNWVLVGADASGLELRMLAHYMAQWDDGAYGDVVLGGDIHSANQRAAGLPTRDMAKTFIYGFLYGAGSGKLGEIVDGGRNAGQKLKDKFLTSLPALAKLLKSLDGKDTLTGLDGRRYPIRSEHMALNTLLQGAGAIVMKKALCIFFEDAEAAYGPHGVRWGLCANVHDEFQWECEKEIADDMGRMAVASITKAGEHFKMGVRLDGEYKVGTSWAETH